MTVAPETRSASPFLARDPSPTARRRSAQRFLDALAFLVVLVALWQLAYWKSEVAITGPLETVETAAALLGSENFWRHALATGRAFGASLILSCVGGVAIGLALGAHRFSGAVAAPMLTALYTIPKVTLYPMVLLIFGLGISAKIAFGVMHGIIPVVIFTMDAVRNINPVLLKTARVLKLSPAQAVARILTLLCVIIGEMFASQQGLGFLIINGMNVHDVRTLTAVVLLLVLFAVASSTILLALDRRLNGARRATDAPARL
jgi:NitT/TauT family transport system permease protein